MGFVNLKEMAKRAKKTEEEIMDLVDLGVIKPQKSYCHPAHFGDGKAIAFYPEEALEDIKIAKAKPEPEPEPEPEAPEEEDEEKEEEDEATGEPTPEKEEPEPEASKAEELAKKKAEEKAMPAAEKKKEKK